MKILCPIPKILLPVDGSEDSKRAVQFAGCLGVSLSKSLSGITLLRVLTGSYLSRHLSYIDFRAEEIKGSPTFKRVREEHIEKNIKPVLDDAEKILKDIGVEGTIEKLIGDGDAANEIVRVANEGNFSTIIMARRGLSEAKGTFLGSVTNKVLHMATKQTVYIVGHKVHQEKACPVLKILIPVDGSSYSMMGAEHAACLASSLKVAPEGITLLRVINLALYMERLKEGVDPEEEARKILGGGKSIFLQTGVSEGLITTKVRTGKPSEEIIKEVEEGEYNLIIMGRKGRGALKDMILGGVSSTVLHRCQNPTIALVSSG